MKPGKLTGSDLKRFILRQINNSDSRIINSAAIGVDCAIFSVKDTDYIATCMQEAAVAGPADMEVVISAKQLFYKAANNLYVEGATPVAATLTLLCPDDVLDTWLKSFMKEVNAVAIECGMPLMGGQTRITKAVNLPYAILTGYGIIENAEDIPESKPSKAGQDIVITKWIGLEGTAYLAKNNRERILERYPAYLVDEAESFGEYMSVKDEVMIARNYGVSAMHDISEGGVFAALWEMAEQSGLGLTIDIKKIPLRQETVEVCERLSYNPYELKSAGSVICACDDGDKLVEDLINAGIYASNIGKFTDSNDRLILNEDEVRYMDRPKVDELYKNQEKRI